MTQKKNNPLFALCIFLLAQFSYADDAVLTLSIPNIPPAFSAEYSVEIDGLSVGKLEVNLIQTDANNWTYHSTSTAQGIIAMFMGSEPVTDTSRLQLLDGIIRPVFYERIRKNKGEDKSEQVIYQWDNLLAQLKYKDRQAEINLNEQITDKFSSQLLIMANIKNIPATMTLPIISRAKLKQYELINYGTEVLNTIYGERETILIGRKKDDSSYRIWADPNLHGLPLQIERIKKGKTEYIVKIKDSTLLQASKKIISTSTNQRSSYFQPR